MTSLAPIAQPAAPPSVPSPDARVGVIITQCLQRDFVGHLDSDAVSSLVHVGPKEAARLLGHDVETGPVMSFMRWARSLPPSCPIEVIHVRDAHDLNNLEQRDHLNAFGVHCIKGTPGAELVCGLEDGMMPDRERFVDAIGLNDFTETDLLDHLAYIRVKHRLASNDGLRVCVIGVWTSAKVQFTLYELVTRVKLPSSHVATCSALTASGSIADHMSALRQVKSLLGVRVCDTVTELCEWLCAGSPPADGDAGDTPGGTTTSGVWSSGGGAGGSGAGSGGAKASVVDGTDQFVGGLCPPITFAPHLGTDPNPTFSPAHKAAIGVLFRHASRLHMTSLAGGKSGASVLKVEAFDSTGLAFSPCVLKLDNRQAVAREQQLLVVMGEIIGQAAPSVLGFCEVGTIGALRSSFASHHGSSSLTSLRRMFQDPTVALDSCVTVLSTLFDKILLSCLACATYERLPLLEYYGFASKYGGAVRQVVATNMGVPVDTDQLVFSEHPDKVTLPNVAIFYESTLESLPPACASSPCFHFVSWVHADVNGENVVADSEGCVSLIDFFWAHRGHAVRDLIYVEANLLFIWVELEFGEMSVILDAILPPALKSLEDGLPESPPDGVTSPAARDAWTVLRFLRDRVARYVRDDTDPSQLAVAMLCFTVKLQRWDSCTTAQKRQAAYAACRLAVYLKERRYPFAKSVRLSTVADHVAKLTAGVSAFRGGGGGGGDSGGGGGGGGGETPGTGGMGPVGLGSAEVASPVVPL